ncbi:MAG: cell surface protein SprA [Bacteroidetes bacterium]|nr:cell surface protein SprA [Bacteroidota bacterium]
MPNFRFRDRHGDPFSNYTTASPFSLKDPKNLKTEISLDSGMNYNISEKMGKLRFRPNSGMSFSDYSRQQGRFFQKNYYQDKSLALDGESAVSGRNLLPKIYLSPVLDRIFGGSYIELNPKGLVTLDLGGSFQKIQNPAIPIRQQRNGGLDFGQQIQLSVAGKVGEKLKINTNFDTNNSFDFQNSMKVDFSGLKEDLLKKIEIGNVSLPLNNSLIKGSQNLFGVKAQLQFGKLTTTIIASTQRGKQSTLHVSGSGNGVSQGKPFEIIASSYDDNRHFFLSQFFRDNFEKWLSDIPGQVTSGVNITRIEVYSINRQNDTQTLRDVVAFMDMGESDKIYRTNVFTPSAPIANNPSRNDANNLFAKIRASGFSSQSVDVDAELQSWGLSLGTDYEKLNSARKLAPTEYTINQQLGYITLQRKLQNDEALAVAFEYTYNGQVYKVGELTEDYSNKQTTEVIYLKMLRPRSINIKDISGRIVPTWNLMMKNIYNLGVSQLTRDGFQLRVIYRDDRTGKDNPQLQDGSPGVRSQQLISVIGLDRLNPYNDVQPDGNFDYVEGITINSSTGMIILPYVEPFNDPFKNLFNKFEPNPDTRAFLMNKYLYDTLYHTTQAEAVLVTTKNKFFIVGSFKAGTGRDIIIQSFNITQGSVKVYAGGTPLREGVDYTVDYNFGKVTILNEGILNSGKDLDITYEQQDPFAFQTRSLLGTRMDYKLSNDVNFGATLLYYNERPLIRRNLIGNEPARNFQYGLDFNMKKNSRVLTKIVDALPFLQTKEVSTVSVNAEFAQLFPGTSNKVNGQGTSFIDDFENAATPYSLLSPLAWKLSSAPRSPDFDLSSGATNDLRAGYRRAKLSWFQIDNIFYVNGARSYAPANIDLSNHYTRPVAPNEIFPYFDPYIGNFYQPVLNLAYYPAERGQYNYNARATDINPDGTFRSPASNWAGITTAIRTNVDFDAANVEYIEFWMMDPFIKGKNGIVNDGTTAANNADLGGKLIFHVGSVSEDMGHDGLQAFENGLPIDGNTTGDGVYQTSAWGYVTNKQYLNNAFDNSPSSRVNQDVGIDGLNSTKEFDDPKFQNFKTSVSSLGLNPAALDAIQKDASSDDFKYYLGPDYDNRKAQILERYKNFNGMENNSPIISGASPYSASGTTIPDNEDLNGDNTLTDLEEYYSYNIDLNPNNLVVGNKYIVDKIAPAAFNGEVTWYLFRIPIRNFDSQVGDINGFKTIKYIRMIMSGFQNPVVLRLANFRTVGQRWRQYAGNLQESALTQVVEPNLDNFTVSTVNIEENGQPDANKPGYVEPIVRDKDVTSVVQRRLNEQSAQLCVTGLPDGDARAMYKTVSMDFFYYGRIKMFMSVHGPLVKDNQVKGFLRLGTDFDQNYYEIELPLKVSPPNERDASQVWPEQNQIDLALDQLYALKVQRDREGFPLTTPYPLGAPKPVGDGKHSIRIMGRPDISQVKLMMIGVRNPKSTDGKAFDVCIWADELRLTDFDQTAGWAANVVLNAKLADLGTVNTSYRHIGFGYGDVQSKISARARSNTDQFDISMNLNLDKLLPRNTGLKIPMFFSYESILIDPKYDPANPDLRINAALQSFSSEKDRHDYLNLIRDRSYRRSINFTNVRKTKLSKDARSHIYDIENFAFTYSFTEANQTNFNYQQNTRKDVKGAVAWQYQSKFGGIQPFKKVELVSSKYFQLIKDFNFNPIPSSISVRGELHRSFTKIAYRNSSTSTGSSTVLPSSNTPNFQKFFVFNRYYNFTWSLTKSLKLDYNATANAIIDEPVGDINTQQKRDSVIGNLKRMGRMKYFEQNITTTYALPFDKFPVTNWISGDYRYNVGYNWRANPLETDPKKQIGNVIQNNRTQTFSGKLDIVKFYNKVKFFKNINTPKPPPKPPKNAAERARLAKADTLPHPPELRFVKALARLVMSVRSINGTYTESDGTILPGFTKSPKFFGLDPSWMAPGLGFVLGKQDPMIAHEAAAQGWITKNPNLTTQFSQNLTKDLNLTALVEPANDVKLTFNARKTSNNSFNEIFRYNIDSTNATNTGFMDFSPSRSGNYSVSFIAIGTTFKNNGSLNSDVFNQFKENLSIIHDKLALANKGNDYDKQSQDVLIPAFIAAYSGSSAKTQSLSPFPKIPLPNWRLDYSGLTKMQPFKDIFSSVIVNHAYSSSYKVLNYSNSLQYNNTSQLAINNSIENYNSGYFASRYSQTDSAQHLIPVYIISQVLISETFAPLIGFSIKTKKKMSLSFKYNTKREISLNVPNAQVTEMNGKEWSFEVGFTKSNMRLPIRDQGRIITLKNDVTFRMTMGVTSNQTIQRRLDEGSTVTNGNINFQLRPNISYVANKKLTVQIYVERTTNDPLVSNSFRRATTKGGVKLIFNLTQ